MSVALLLAAAGVGFGHAVMPDHWMPLALAGRVYHRTFVVFTEFLSGVQEARLGVNLFFNHTFA